MSKRYSICVIPGDGIGTEVVECALRVLSALAERHSVPAFSFDRQEGGHGTFLGRGTALPPESVEAAKRADAVLVGAMDVAALPMEEPEPLTRLRKELGVLASIRPAISFKGLNGQGARIDCLVVREVTEGIYSGIEYAVGRDVACGVRVITREASANVARVAFEQALKRRGRVTAVHKLGALKQTDGLFIEAVQDVAKEFPSVELELRNIDACAMDMVREPDHFDVICATNAFGDILSDLAIGIGSGLGLAPSACIGKVRAYFEPVHGSAPDIAGKGVANPCATILSAAMMLRYLGEEGGASAIEQAVEAVLVAGAPRTGDLGGTATSAEMTDAIMLALDTQ